MVVDQSWLDPDSSWWAKANRAHEHLRSLRKQVDDFRASDPFTVSPEPTGTPDRVAYRVHIHKDVPVAISTTVGDVLHNLRSALDNLAYEVARRSLDGPMKPAQEKACAFPVCATPEKFVEFFGEKKERAALYGPKARAALQSAQPFAFAVDTTPTSLEYEYKWHALSRLTALWNVDKHRHLTTAAWRTSLTFWMSNTDRSNRRWIPSARRLTDGAILGHMIGRDPDVSDEVFHEFDLVLEDDPVHDLGDLDSNPQDMVKLLEGWHGQVTVALRSVIGAM